MSNRNEKEEDGLQCELMSVLTTYFLRKIYKMEIMKRIKLLILRIFQLVKVNLNCANQMEGLKMIGSAMQNRN